jgi:hypothetical protein
MMEEKIILVFVLFSVVSLGFFSVVFLFSFNSTAALVSKNSGFVYSGVYDGKDFTVYNDKIIVTDFENVRGTGFHYDSPFFQISLGKRVGCPIDCYSVRHEDIQKLVRIGFSVDLFGDKLYGCWCPENFF